MKWKNKGHEYDEVYKEIEQKKSFYMFGAGDYGKQFLNIFKDEIDIKGYIDNNPQKQGSIINGYKCFALNEIMFLKEIGIVVTMSQVARVRPVEQLIKAGYKKNIDFFIIEEFDMLFLNFFQYQIQLNDYQ